jgi:predicted amidohydrolase YtcJ
MHATMQPTATHSIARLADLVIRAGAIYSMTDDRAIYRAIAIRDDRIVAVSTDPHGLDDLVADGARVLDDHSLTILPAFVDTHNHLLFAGRGVHDVPVGQARSIAEFVELIRQRAAVTPKGEWIRTSAGWHELSLAEKRMPTAHELDQATTDHPVQVKRGGHNEVVNSLVLRMAGITRDTPTPPGGTIVRDSDGNPTGWLIDAARAPLERLLPPPSIDEQVEGLRLASLEYAKHGLGTVRDAYVTRAEMLLYQVAAEENALAIRVRPMIGMPRIGSVADTIAEIDGWGVRSGFGDDWLRIWGLKMVLDGGAENGAVDEPYANNPDFFGQLMWAPDDLVRVVDHAVRCGWSVGTHAWGDHAVRALLDVYERVLADDPGVAAGSLVIEHGGLANAEQRARAIRLGIPVTIQHPLLYGLVQALLESFGEQRMHRFLPVREWVEEGALVGAGSDYPIGSYDAMHSIWGMVTRQTSVGVYGPEHAIDRYLAVRLHTAEAARLLGESDRLGTLEPGRLADLVAYRTDPITCEIDELPTLAPAFTMVGGTAAYDRDGLLGAPA